MTTSSSPQSFVTAETGEHSESSDDRHSRVLALLQERCRSLLIQVRSSEILLFPVRLTEHGEIETIAMHHDHIRNGTGTPIATAIRIAAGMIPAEDLTLLDFLRREIKDDLGVEVDEVLDVVELVSASDKDSPLLACTLSTSEGAVLRAGPKGHLLDIFWLNKEMMKARDDDKVNGGLMGGFVQYAEERGIVARLQEKRRGSIAAAAKTQAVVAKRKSLPRSSKGSVKRRAKK